MRTLCTLQSAIDTMHDGYLFTLGICGTASGSSPAPALIGAMLRAIPPVKRAALLGEVLLLDDPTIFADPLRETVLADIRDAELLLIVSPLRSGRLPGRLTQLLKVAAEMPLGGKHALVVLLGTAEDRLRTAEHVISRLIEPSGMHIIETLTASDELISPTEQAAIEAATLRAYQVARALRSDLLP